MTTPEALCRRCGHSKDEHWWSGFVCHTCGCTLFKPAVPSTTLEDREALADALLSAEEILAILHYHGTKGLEQQSSAGRIADALEKVRVCKRAVFAEEARP